jgi:hypothetical protein
MIRKDGASYTRGSTQSWTNEVFSRSIIHCVTVLWVVKSQSQVTNARALSYAYSSEGGQSDGAWRHEANEPGPVSRLGPYLIAFEMKAYYRVAGNKFHVRIEFAANETFMSEGTGADASRFGPVAGKLDDWRKDFSAASFQLARAFLYLVNRHASPCAGKLGVNGRHGGGASKR